MALIDYRITVIKNGIFPSNTYILTDINSKLSVIVDPGLDIEALKKAETRLNLTPVAILATHGHFDHVGHVTYFQKKYNIPFYLHEEDLKLSKSANFYLKIAKLGLKIETPVPDYLFKGQQDSLHIKGFNFLIHNFPGHTAGSCIIQYQNALFSGDILYKKGLGFNHFPGEDKNKLRQSVKNIFESFNDDDMIYPGHGSETSLGHIKTENKELSAFILNNNIS